MKYKERNGLFYSTWWEPAFEHHIMVPTPDNFGSQLKVGLDAIKWLHEQYPNLSGDASMSRLDETEKAWYDFDWGATREGDAFIFYFKDPKVAAHFKLAWG